MRKTFAILLALMLALSLAVPAAPTATKPSEAFAILYTTDVHTYLDGPMLYAVIEEGKSDMHKKYKHFSR